MGTAVFIVLLILAVGLFLAKNWISDKTLERLANAAAVVALIAAALVYIVDPAVPPKPISQTDSPPAVSEPTNTPTSCVCQSATDDDTLRCLIHAESEAANQSDLTLIQQIFAPNATILQGDTGEEWDSPMAYYEPTFASLDFTDARHYDIQQVEITEQFYRYTSGSSGYYAAPNATPTPYDNENPSEHWTFGKSDARCWIIARYEFNAKHIPFP